MVIETDFITRYLYENDRRLAVSQSAWKLFTILALSSPRRWSLTELEEAHGGDVAIAQRELIAVSPTLRSLFSKDFSSGEGISLPLSGERHQIYTPLRLLEEAGARLMDKRESLEDRRRMIVYLLERTDSSIPDTGEAWTRAARSRAWSVLREAFLVAHNVDLDEAPEVLAGFTSANRQNFLGLAVAPAGARLLLGREDELEILPQFLAQSNIVTLVGPAGVGKTALAGHVLDQTPVLPQYAMDLRGTRSSAQLLDRLLALTKVSASYSVLNGQAEAVTLIRAKLASGGLMLLDNAEELKAPALEALRKIIQGSEARFLFTSRKMLNLPGEKLFIVRPLALPSPEEASTVKLKELAERYPSVQLFLERSMAHKGHMPQAAEAVHQALERTGGLPLEIGLAASNQHSGAVTIEEVLDSLADRERQVIRAISPFINTFTLTDAQAVAQLSPEELEFALDILANLGLLMVTQGDQLRLPVSIREAVGTTVDPNQTTHYIRYIESAGSELRLMADVDQVVRLLLARNEGERAIQLVDRVVPAACQAVQVSIVESLLWEIKRSAPDLDMQGQAILADSFGRVFLTAGRNADARGQLRSAQRLWDELGERRKLARALSNIAVAETRLHRSSIALTALESALDIFRDLQEDNSVASILSNIGAICLEIGNTDRARQASHEAAKIARLGDMTWYPTLLLGAAEADLLDGRDDSALIVVVEALKASSPDKHPSQRARMLLLWALAQPDHELATECAAAGWHWHQSRGVHVALCAQLYRQCEKQFPPSGTVEIREVEELTRLILANPS